MKEMKNIIKKNQVIIAALAIMIIVAGYLNFTRDKVGNNAAGNDVETNAQIPEDQLEIPSGESVDDENDLVADSETNTSVGDAVMAQNSVTQDFFVRNKLSREQTRSKNEETLKEIINSEKVTDAQKQDAIDQMITLTDIKEKESVTETLLEAKGFPESLVTINDGKVEVVVNANNLTEQQIAQIEDVVKRKTGIAAKNIVISPAQVGDTAATTSEDTSTSEKGTTNESNVEATASPKAEKQSQE